jgi:hypothetical protein
LQQGKKPGGGEDFHIEPLRFGGYAEVVTDPASVNQRGAIKLGTLQGLRRL